jgi:hypothetical protein
MLIIDMKKETLIAIILGAFLGITIALITTLTTKKQIMKQKKIIAPKITPSLPPLQPEIQTLEIIQPPNDYITNKDIILIKGKAGKKSLIVAQSPTSEKVIQTKEKDFSLEFPLSLGENLIKITSYGDKNIDEKTLKVYYLKE